MTKVLSWLRSNEPVAVVGVLVEVVSKVQEALAGNARPSWRDLAVIVGFAVSRALVTPSNKPKAVVAQ